MGDRARARRRLRSCALAPRRLRLARSRAHRKEARDRRAVRVWRSLPSGVRRHGLLPASRRDFAIDRRAGHSALVFPRHEPRMACCRVAARDASRRGARRDEASVALRRRDLCGAPGDGARGERDRIPVRGHAPRGAARARGRAPAPAANRCCNRALRRGAHERDGAGSRASVHRGARDRAAALRWGARPLSIDVDCRSVRLRRRARAARLLRAAMAGRSPRPVVRREHRYAPRVGRSGRGRDPRASGSIRLRCDARRGDRFAACGPWSRPVRGARVARAPPARRLAPPRALGAAHPPDRSRAEVVVAALRLRPARVRRDPRR